MELISNIAIAVFAIAFFTGFLTTAISGSSRVIKYILGFLTLLSTLAMIIGFILSRGLLIFLFTQIIVLILILFFVLITGAIMGGGVYTVIHKRSTGKKIPVTELGDYLPISEFAEVEGITEERAVSRIKNGYYLGGNYKNDWYVHQSELSEPAD